MPVRIDLSLHIDGFQASRRIDFQAGNVFTALAGRVRREIVRYQRAAGIDKTTVIDKHSVNEVDER
jgi:hypothetical protein